MTVQHLCHARLATVSLATPLLCIAAAWADPAMNDYPTVARVEYVNECIERSTGGLATLYQCACVIDRMARTFTYDEFVEAHTFAKYSTLPGEGGGLFRDSEKAQRLAKQFRESESTAYKECGMKPPVR
jgi:hypothetical protein